LYKTAWSAITHSFIVPDANGVYELTGTGFVSGDVLSGKHKITHEVLAEVATV
jgi:hypothetical protein